MSNFIICVFVFCLVQLFQPHSSIADASSFRKLSTMKNTAQMYTTKSTLDPAEKIWFYAKASYCAMRTVKWDCGRRCNENPETVLLKYFRNARTSTGGILALNHVEKRIILSYKGSQEFADWLSNIDIRKAYIDKRSFPGVKVHKGYKRCIDSVENQVKPALELMAKMFPKYEILVTGHSLGGALGDLSTVYIATGRWNVDPKRVRLVTFGQPRIGNHAFQVLMNKQQFSGIKRFVQDNDPFPHLPGRFLGFRHNQQEYWIHGNKNNVQVCDDANDESKACSRSLWWFSYKPYQHKKYFNIPVANCDKGQGGDADVDCPCS